MSANPNEMAALSAIAIDAVLCTACADDFGLPIPSQFAAQPRFVGLQYWAAKPRVSIVGLNPGRAGPNTNPVTPIPSLSERFAKGEISLIDLFASQSVSIQSWAGGRFYRAYIDLLGLTLDNVSFLNIAWCPTEDNSYPRKMLNNCFEKHTSNALAILRPDIVILSGRKTHAFSTQILAILPYAIVLNTVHYASRRSRVHTEAALIEVRARIAGWKPQSGAPELPA